MGRPWDLSGDDLDAWARRGQAFEKLPALVRRLLFATTPLTGIEMRADGGTRLGGPDGTVYARQATAQCPAGLSLWELSVEEKIKRKLDEDFEKRTAKPELPVDPAQVTYIAITARRFGGKKRWIEEKQAKGRWAEVRLYDADDLAAWLEQAPVVARWFAEEELSRPTQDLITVEEFLLELSQRTRPPLPVDIVLAGEERTKAAKKLLEALVQTDDRLRQMPAHEAYPVRTWRLAAEGSEEALLFVAAVLSMPGREAEHLRARTLIVGGEDAFQYCLRAQALEPLLLVPRFERIPPAQLAGHRVQVVLPVAWGERIAPGEGMTLDVIPFHPLALALQAAGFEDTERLARDADGRISKLLPLLESAHTATPTPGGSTPEMAALLLAGAWMPAREADRAALRKLGADPDKAERRCVELSHGEDPAVEAHEEHPGGRVFRLVAPRVAWKTYGHDLTDSDLDRFFEVALEALAPLPPFPEGDARARIQAIMERKRTSCSEAMVTSISASIAWVAVADEEGYLLSTHPPGRGAELARALVRRLLPPERHVWWSLSGRLQDLAEAAPRQFLEQLSTSLDRGEEGVGGLFSGRSPGMGPDGSLSHAGQGGTTEVLWSLETLAWSPEFLMRVVPALARLVAHDRLPENLSSRPIHTLRHILHPLMPQSNSSAPDRIAALQLLFGGHNDVAWQICTGLLHDFGGIILVVPAPRPRYRRWVGKGMNDQAMATDLDIKEQVHAMLELLLQHAGDDPVRWASLVPLPHSSIGWDVLDALKDASPRLAQKDDKAILWDAIREELGRLASSVEHGVDGAPSGLREWWSRLDVLHDAYLPSDFVLRHRWLFGGRDWLPRPVPGGHKGNEDRRLALQHEAIEALGEYPDRWDMLGRLARAVKQPPLLGGALAKASFADELEAALLAVPPEAQLGDALAPFWGSRLQHHGWEWFEHLVPSLLERGRVEEATDVALLFRGGQQLWDLLDRLGEPVRSAYWRKHEPLWLDHLSPAEYERGISALLEAGRAEAAAEAVYQGADGDRVAAPTILRVLDALRDAEQQGRKIQLRAYQIEPLFLALDRHPGVDEERVIALEIAHADRLHEPGLHRKQQRGARRFYGKLERSPDYFVEVLRRLERPRGGVAEMFDQSSDARGVERKHLSTLLYHWADYPFKGLSIPERETALEGWCRDVLRKAEGAGCKSLAVHHLETILARVDEAEDGYWPCLVARCLLESREIGSLITARANGRGWKTRGLGEAGDQERVLASDYQTAADALRARYPRTAEMLEDMAKGHLRDAARDDAEARRERIEYGELDRPRRHSSPAIAESMKIPDTRLTRLEIREVGPAPELVLDLAARLNLLTGDNSLGKTFVLEVLWWVLTGSWAGAPAKPRPRRTRNGKLGKSKAVIGAEAGQRSVAGTYNAIHERWSTEGGGPLAPGLVIYARVDGGFSVWDPVRNITPMGKGELDISDGYHFTPEELWHGKTSVDKATVLCRGLLEDLVSWRSERRHAYSQLENVLARISPAEERIRLGRPARFRTRDARDFPTLLLPYGQEFAELASASVKRILGLAYVLVWAVSEVQRAAPVAEIDPLRHVTLLIDEIEAHLHPKWQRTILRALLGLAEDIAPQTDVQLVVTTHAPLVLVSIEKLFDESKDALFDFNLEPAGNGAGDARKVSVVERAAWELHGDVNSWLASEIFDGTKLRSPEAEEAIEEASRLLDESNADRKRGRKAHQRLVGALGPKDPFLLRWRYLAEKKGWLS